MTEVLDRQLAIQRAGGKASLAEELHGMLLKSLPTHRDAIQQSWEAKDRDKLYYQVHKLNGSTRYCGVPQLEQRCDALEKQIHGGETELEAGYQALMSAITAVLESEQAF